MRGVGVTFETDVVGASDAVVDASAPRIVGLDPDEWTELIEFGRRRGELSTEEIVDALHDVELLPENIETIRSAIERCGIRVDQSFELDDTGELRRPLAEQKRRGRATASRASSDDSTSDAVRLYLHEISRIPLIDAAEERVLGRRIADGQAAERELELLGENGSNLERRRLKRLADAGRRARHDMTQANLRLVVSIAKRYTKTTMPLADAIQSGNIGLMKAVEKYDYSRGFKFSTYATWWIKQSISRAVAEESRNIRLPAHAMENVNRAIRTQRDLAQQLQREPSIQEIAMALGEPAERVAEWFSLAADTMSLDQPTREDGDTTFADNLAATNVADPSDSMEIADMREAVRAVLVDLPAREQEVMRMRFGLDGDEGATLEEVGQAFSITRERVRQIEVRTLFRLRHTAGGRVLRDFVEP
ncbi:MAG: sigma-70 family RNA polymerase sigma factor [Acidimicrobiia bacterium]|nr:sigma-70 family RNA polymerase sigma factor [Actinomycetota bacterium]NDB06000.1 sigma-70 family RNA polymerase sigma factor [Acidimicrobiia bacterium]NDD97510.1 sigma-70 family RNA polymerase sigma factor [Actinomycetota bacterium]NDE59239.1 sigma-70 family RNA polymerase sigma factor [Acidimicrobiia bacterium]NDE81510.1 sigma-70 family RNA polymerase sigma factor [Actinomycetota bacterium]